MAQAIADKLTSDPAIESVEIAGPGFLNIRLGPAAAGTVAGAVVEQGEAYGHGTLLAGQRVNVEFVSANPTGPIHIGGVLPRDGQSLDDLGRARLWLADATRIVLANGLGLLGVTAPDRL